MDLPIEMPVSIRLPSGAGVRMVEAAEREWGAGAVHEVAPGVTRVLFWLGGKRQFASQSSVRPVGGFRVRWEYPSTAQATIERLGWDLTGGSSELEVRQVIDLLAGWPVATPSVRQRAGAA
jgi:hypothetical protein